MGALTGSPESRSPLSRVQRNCLGAPNGAAALQPRMVRQKDTTLPTISCSPEKALSSTSPPALRERSRRFAASEGAALPHPYHAHCRPSTLRGIISISYEIG